MKNATESAYCQEYSPDTVRECQRSTAQALTELYRLLKRLGQFVLIPAKKADGTNAGGAYPGAKVVKDGKIVGELVPFKEIRIKVRQLIVQERCAIVDKLEGLQVFEMRGDEAGIKRVILSKRFVHGNVERFCASNASQAFKKSVTLDPAIEKELLAAET